MLYISEMRHPRLDPGSPYILDNTQVVGSRINLQKLVGAGFHGKKSSQVQQEKKSSLGESQLRHFLGRVLISSRVASKSSCESDEKSKPFL